MPYTGNLLKSDGGVELVAELCLAIAEYAMVDEPKIASTLMTVSKVCWLMFNGSS